METVPDNLDLSDQNAFSEASRYRSPAEWSVYLCGGVKIAAMHWMTQLIQQCDDDLLDAVYGIL